MPWIVMMINCKTNGKRSPLTVKKMMFWKFSKVFNSTKKCVSFSCPNGHSPQKLGFYDLCSVASEHTHTHTHTHTKVNTEDTLSWFQECFLQPINVYSIDA